MNLEDRKAMLIEKAGAKLSEEQLATFTTEVNAATTLEELRTVKYSYYSPEAELQSNKDNISIYEGFLKNRGHSTKEISRRIGLMLGATTYKEFVDAYQGIA